MNPDICPVCNKELGPAYWPAQGHSYFSSIQSQVPDVRLGIGIPWVAHFNNKHPTLNLQDELNKIYANNTHD